MFAESSKVFIFQKFAVKFYFGLSLDIFFSMVLHCLWKICATPAFVPQSKSTEFVVRGPLSSHKVNLPSCVAWRPLCHKVNLPSCVAWQLLCHKVNLPRCEARRRNLIMTCDIFGTE